ncbi:MAG: hypothetical protein ACRDQ5_15830, partial [Sciscionella sp.]
EAASGGTDPGGTVSGTSDHLGENSYGGTLSGTLSDSEVASVPGGQRTLGQRGGGDPANATEQTRRFPWFHRGRDVRR